MIRVSYKSEVLGCGVFYEGDSVDEIRNIPARQAAQKAIATGQTQNVGMWTVEIIPESETTE